MAPSFFSRNPGILWVAPWGRLPWGGSATAGIPGVVSTNKTKQNKTKQNKTKQNLPSPFSRACLTTALRELDEEHTARAQTRISSYTPIRKHRLIERYSKKILVPEKGTYRPRPREGLGRTPELGRLPILRTSVDLPETADFREQYFCGAAIQSTSNYYYCYCYYYYYYCLIAPLLYLTYLILSRT